MTVSLVTRLRPRGVIAAAALVLLLAGPAQAQVLPYEISVAEVEAGRVRHLAQRLSKQNLLYQLHLGVARKSDLVETAARIDRVLETLEQGSPGYAVPAPWTRELREQVSRLDQTWGALRKIAVASPYDYLLVTRQFMPRPDMRGDPLLVRYFDSLSLDVITESEKLMALYDKECRAASSGPGLVLCQTATISGYTAMLSERAVNEAVYVVAGLDAGRNRAKLKKTLTEMLAQQKSNDESPFFKAALSPERGKAGKFAAELLAGLREDGDILNTEFAILGAGDERNFDLSRLLLTQERMITKVERLTALLLRYANIAYGS